MVWSGADYGLLGWTRRVSSLPPVDLKDESMENIKHDDDYAGNFEINTDVEHTVCDTAETGDFGHDQKLNYIQSRC